MPFYDDDGTEINPDLIPKPSLCVTCQNDEKPEQEMFCVMCRFDQQDENDFYCDSFILKSF